MEKIIIISTVILALWYFIKVLRMKDQDKLDYDQKRHIQMILAEDE